MNNNDYTIRLKSIRAVFLGLDGVGKTSILEKYLGIENIDDPYSTILSNDYSKKIKFDDLDYTVRIIDTPGRERFINVLRVYIRNARIIFLVFDMTRKESFLHLDRLLEMISENINNNKVMFVLIGNKADLLDKFEIKEKDAKKFAEILNAKFFLSSAKNSAISLNEFIDGVFHDYIKLYNERLDPDLIRREENINLERRNRRRRNARPLC